MEQVEKSGLMISIGGSLLVGVAGLAFAILTASQAILLDGLFNITYFIISLFTLKVARLVLQGDDEYFPAGYAFFEPLINGVKGTLILGLSLMALWGAGAALLTGGRSIAVGWAMVYGALATAICWSVVLLLKKKVKRCSSPLLKADADGWIVNAAISTAAFATFVSIGFINKTPWNGVVPYIDPVLVILVSGITLNVPVRMAWNALMELVNRSPSAAVRSTVRTSVEKVLASVPASQISVRVLQPGRSRLVFVHVILQADATMPIEEMDILRTRAQAALAAHHALTQLDILFTKDPRWGAPLEMEQPQNSAPGK